MQYYELAVLGCDLLAPLFLERARRQYARILWVRDSETPVDTLPWGIEVMMGPYHFESERHLACATATGTVHFAAERTVLACGASPLRPGWMLEHPRLVLADHWERLPESAESVAIIGMGHMGVQTLRRLQGKIPRLYCLDARDIHCPPQAWKVTGGTSCWLSANNAVIGIRADEQFLSLYLENGQTRQVDAAVVCCGSRGKTETRRLKATGLSTDDRGKVWCNDDYETWTPGIYALGDVVGYPQLEISGSEQVDRIITAMQAVVPNEQRPLLVG